MNISFGFDKLPANGEVCHACKIEVKGFVYIPYSQIFSPEKVTYYETPFCEKCYKEKWLDGKDQ